MPHYALFPVVSVLAQRAVGHGIAIEQHKGKFELGVRLDGGRLLGVGQRGVGGHLLIEIPDGHRLGLGAAEVVDLEVILLLAFRLEFVPEGGDVSLCGLGAADVVLDAGQEEGCDGQGDGAGVLLVEIVEGREETVGVSLLIQIVLQHQRIATENAVVEIVLVGALTAAVGESLHHVEVQQPRAQIVAVVHVILNGLRGGAVDIEAVIIRPPFEPNLAFTIDPQAMLRAVRFAARYEFTVEENTAKAIEANLPKIEEIKPSLRRYVVMKGFCDKCAFRTYQYNVKYGILGYLCPMLKDYIGNADYESYLKTVFDYVDSQKAMEASLAYCILFMPPVMKELGDKEPTMDNITAAFDKLEQGSGQDKLFWLEDYRYTKKDPMLIWKNYRLMTNDATLKDAALVNSLRKEFTFKSSLMLLNGMALYDSSLKKYADEWNKDLPTSTDLDNMEADYTVKDGEILTGISEHGLIIPDGVTITLENAGTLEAIVCMGDAEIILSKGTTNIIDNSEHYGSAILTKAGRTLTINGEGALVAFGGQEGAGIGGNGNIVINNGTINAYGGQYGAGIGSEMHSPCGDITINGGKITAKGGDQAAGIGSGQDGECGDIAIKSTVTEVVAIAGDECTKHIGAGVGGTCGEVTIEDPAKIKNE